MDLNSYAPGRPPFPQTMETLEEMVKQIREEPGIPSAKLAKKVGLTSLQCSTFAKRLAKQGFIEIQKKDRALVYTIRPPALK